MLRKRNAELRKKKKERQFDYLSLNVRLCNYTTSNQLKCVGSYSLH